MDTGRSGIGGRKPVEVTNPFVTYDDMEDEYENVLYENERIDFRIEDTIVGCIRSIDSSKKGRQASVNWKVVIRVYRNCNTITRQTIQAYLQCSESQAKRYIKTIKLCNIFLPKIIEKCYSTEILYYPELSHSQVHNGYLLLDNVSYEVNDELEQ